MTAAPKTRSTLNPPVFYTSAVLIFLLVLYATAFQAHAQALFEHVQT